MVSFSVVLKAVGLTTSSLSMAAESLSPVALKSKTLATGPLQHKTFHGFTSLLFFSKSLKCLDSKSKEQQFPEK